MLGFPLGAMNGFASHPGTPSSGFFDLGYSAYTSMVLGIGTSIGFLYEAEWFGVGAEVSDFLGPHGAGAFGDVHGLVYLSSDSTSPFLGAGLGFMASEVFFDVCNAPPQLPQGSGAMTEVEVGFEFLRRSPEHVRVQLSLEVLIPLYSDDDGSSPVGVLLNTRVAF